MTQAPCPCPNYPALLWRCRHRGTRGKGHNKRNGANDEPKPRPSLQPGETRAYPVLPLRDIVVFPHMIVPLFVGREKSIKALEEVMRSDTFILLATQKNASDDDPATDAIFETGTLASVLQLLKLPDGTVKVLVEGAERAKVLKYTDRSDYYEADATVLADDVGDRVEAEAMARSVVTEFEGYVKLNKKVSPEVVGVVQQIEDYAKLADTVASHLAVKIPDKQDILETPSVTAAPGEGARLDGERNLRPAGREAHPHARQAADGEDAARVLPQRADEGDPEGAWRRGRQGRTCRTRRQDQEDQALEGSPRESDARAQEAPPDVADVGGSDGRAQLSRLAAVHSVEQEEQGQEGPQAGAEKILDDDHYGLEKVKERIVEYLAVQQRANKLTGPILCLVGPPGVGKTSLGKSIAKATGREFVRVSLGGVRDEAEIRGHRRTYIGSMPGKIIQSMRKAKTCEPAVPARRGRQDGRRFPRRSVVGFA